MKKTMIGLLTIVFLATVAHAAPNGSSQGQGQNMRGAGQGNRMAQFQQSLDLSDSQVEQIRSIRQSGGGREDIRAVLNEDQRVKLDEMRDQRQGRGGKGRGPGRGQGQGPAPAANNPHTEAADEPAGEEADGGG